MLTSAVGNVSNERSQSRLRFGLVDSALREWFVVRGRSGCALGISLLLHLRLTGSCIGHRRICLRFGLARQCLGRVGHQILRRAIHISIVLFALLLVFRTDVIGDIAPIAHAVQLECFKQQQFFVCTPVRCPERRAHEIDDAVSMVGLVRRHVHTRREAAHTQIEILTFGAFDANQLRDVGAAVVAMVQGTLRL